MTIEALLREYETKELQLSPESAEVLRALPSNAIEVLPHPTPGTSRVRANRYVGTVVTPELTLHIQPKAGPDGLFFMLGLTPELLKLSPETTDRAQATSVYAILLAILAGQLESLLIRGLRRGYVEREQDLASIRGRILVEQAVRRSPVVLTLPCRYDDYTADLPANQVIRETLERIALPRSLDLARRIRRLRNAFRVVSRWRRIDLRSLETFTYNRLDAHYRPIHQLCHVLLEGLGVDQPTGVRPLGTFLVNMDKVFERFVGRWLDRELAPDIQVHRQWRGHLDVGKSIPIQPDLVFEVNGEPRLVADTKYKLVETKPSSSDAYQVLAYCRVLNVPTGLLIYPTWSSAPRRFRIPHGKTQIIADGIRMGPPELVKLSISLLASRLVQHASSAFTASA